LLIVLSLTTAEALAQKDSQRMAEVLCAGDPECLAMARHRLTAEGLRKMFIVDRELETLMNEQPDLQTRMDELAKSIDPQRRLGKVAFAAQVHERVPEIAQLFRRHNTTAREYLMTHAVAMVTAMADDSFPGDEAMTPALKFWRSMDPALKAEADAWKKMRGYDKGLNR
jgi:hypothetical protein